ncbi:MAG: helix-turn-helix domain-containing protein [Candidatus Nanoarchaeia archaeon]
MERELTLKKIEGLQTIETAARSLNMSKQTTLNLLSKLKKEGYVTTTGGGRQKRIYKISLKKQRSRDPGMFDILNKYSPKMKLAPWFDHQVHGKYGPEEALIDAIKTKSFRVILVSLRLFSHIRDWKKVYRLAKENDCWQQVGALYEVARKYFRVKSMIERYIPKKKFKKKIFLLERYKTKEKDFYSIEKKWNVTIPFRKGDLLKTEL